MWLMFCCFILNYFPMLLNAAVKLLKIAWWIFFGPFKNSKIFAIAVQTDFASFFAFLTLKYLGVKVRCHSLNGSGLVFFILAHLLFHSYAFCLFTMQVGGCLLVHLFPASSPHWVNTLKTFGSSTEGKQVFNTSWKKASIRRVDYCIQSFYDSNYCCTIPIKTHSK